jgi:hypothetical protein
MTTEHEAPFTPDEVKRVLEACQGEALLVGGQALAFWALHYEVDRPEDLALRITSDVDFVGIGSTAARVARELGWKLHLPTLDDATPQMGKVTRTLPDGGVKQIVFLSGVGGLDTPGIRKRAATGTWPGSRVEVRVMHPLDVLMSRIKNLETLPEKRNAIGVSQASLAISIANAYLRELIAMGEERQVLKAVERVIDIALDPGATRIYLRYGIDPLRAIPIDEVKIARFQERWPRVLADIDRRRRALERQYEAAAGRDTQRKKPRRPPA